MTETTKPSNLRQKLIEVYRKLDHVEKAGVNSKQNYKFVRAGDVLRSVRNVFAELGIYAQPNYDLLGTYDIKTNSGGVMHTAMVKATIVLHDADSEEKITISGLGDGADSGDKGVYKAQTGATKNALRNASLLPDEADPEADQSVDEAVSEPVRISRPPKPVVVETTIDHLNNNTITHDLGPLPDESKLQSYTDRLRALREKLQSEGKLKPSAGLSAPRKVLNYVLKSTGSEDLKKISIVQWDAFLQYAEKMDPVQLVELINQK